jgi:YVTN family beta-propeller protein
MGSKLNLPLRPRISSLILVGLWFIWPACVWPQSITATLPVSGSVAVNRATNKIYVPDAIHGVVTVLDGVSHASITVNAGKHPHVVVVDEATNKIYVANGGVRCVLGACTWDPASVTVIDGASNLTATVVDSNAKFPCSMAVNPSTHRIYVGNCSSHNVSVIDGATNNIITTVVDQNAKSFAPVAIAVNPTTNKIYIANYPGSAGGSGNVTVIDGATNSTFTVTDPNAVGPNAVAVNTVTNKVYVTNNGSCPPPATNQGNVTIIDGETNSTTTVTDPRACYPQAVAVNQTTNTIYVANANDPTLSGKGVVTVIDGATNATATIIDPNGKDALALSVDEVTNSVYVANQGYCDDVYLCVPGTYPGSISVINGNTKAVKTLIDPMARGPSAVAIDPVTNQIYVANGVSGNLTVIDGSGTATAHTLAVLLAGDGGGTVASNPVGIDCGTTCTDTYPIGTAVKLMAAAAPGSYFMGWSGPCMGSGSCDSVTNQDQFVTANFSTAVAVPNVVGLTQAAASSAISGAGLGVGKVTHQSSGTLASGQVMSESPSAGSNAAPASMVDLVVSSGAPSSGGGGAIDLLTLGSILGCLLFAVRRVRAPA